MAVGREQRMTHRVYTPVNPVHPPCVHPPFDLRLTKPQVNELPQRHDSVLPRREVGELTIYPYCGRWADFLT
jgi:hypothetical protein